MRESLVVGRSYPFSMMPSRRGDYCYWGCGCATCVPCYAAFDGEKWVDGPGAQADPGDNFWIFTDEPEPYGHYNPDIGLDPVESDDLASRLARFKTKKREQS
jgi:hypothetical protein